MYPEKGDIGGCAPVVACLTDDPIEILRFAYEAWCSGIPVALVTLVEVRGGNSRPIGAQMAVRADGLYCGFVSGGCAEAAVAAEALEDHVPGSGVAGRRPSVFFR